MVFFLDVASVFEKIWHEGLIEKLKQNGITESCLQLFNSYLHNRKQIVVVDGKKSHIEQIKAGIPQGSRLGPLSFIIYINEIKEDLESDFFKMFADDTTLIASGPDKVTTSS